MTHLQTKKDTGWVQLTRAQEGINAGLRDAMRAQAAAGDMAAWNGTKGILLDFLLEVNSPEARAVYCDWEYAEWEDSPSYWTSISKIPFRLRDLITYRKPLEAIYYVTNRYPFLHWQPREVWIQSGQAALGSNSNCTRLLWCKVPEGTTPVDVVNGRPLGFLELFPEIPT